MAGGITNAGCSTIAILITNNASTGYFNSASAYLAVGSASTAFAASQTDLQEAGSNKERNAMVAGYPTVASQVITFRALWAAASANFRWNEIGVFNAATGGTMLCRDVQDLGLKPNTQSWQLTFAVQIAPD